MSKQKVALFGASGTMGFQAFLELWKRRDQIDIVILVLASEQKLALFRAYEIEAGVPLIKGPGVAEGNGLKIVWGDATNILDVKETVRGVDWVLDAMAYISPEADYHPERAKAVNTDAIHNILIAIQEEPCGVERIRFIYTGTVAETGNRPLGIHYGRVGDPLKPSIFDHYAITKIAGERAVIESPLRYWVSLRMTFIMPTSFHEWVNMIDPILLHMPLDACMENLTDRDAGYGLVNCLDIPADSDFWRRVYNMSGGPEMRCAAYEYLDASMKLLGSSGVESCTRRRWFARRNFHMQFFEDSHILNTYLHHWRDTLEEYWDFLRNQMPGQMRLLANSCKYLPLLRWLVEKQTYRRLAAMANYHKNGTAYWRKKNNNERINAFYGSFAEYDAIPEWKYSEKPMLSSDWRRLDHGYDEENQNFTITDLETAANFRGGHLLSSCWDKDLYSPLEWQCSFGHRFRARPYTILKTGHWCPVCINPPWNFDQQARVNPFFAQTWYADHDPSENYLYQEDCTQDIFEADIHWKEFLQSKLDI